MAWPAIVGLSSPNSFAAEYQVHCRSAPRTALASESATYGRQDPAPPGLEPSPSSTTKWTLPQFPHPALSHRHADIGGCQYGGIVDAIAQHRHVPPLLAESIDNFTFSVRRCRDRHAALRSAVSSSASMPTAAKRRAVGAGYAANREFGLLER